MCELCIITDSEMHYTNMEQIIFTDFKEWKMEFEAHQVDKTIIVNARLELINGKSIIY